MRKFRKLIAITILVLFSIGYGVGFISSKDAPSSSHSKVDKLIQKLRDMGE